MMIQNDPFEGLQRDGVVVRRSESSSTTPVRLQGIPIDTGGSASERFEMVLPRPTALHAVFSRESFGKKLVKLFKRELQAGDPAFDDVVYVAANDSDATSRFLADPSARALVTALVREGATIEAEGTRLVVTVVQPGQVVVSDTKSIERLTRCVLDFAD
jgi:hypothetical protein